MRLQKQEAFLRGTSGFIGGLLGNRRVREVCICGWRKFEMIE